MALLVSLVTSISSTELENTTEKAENWKFCGYYELSVIIWDRGITQW